MKTFKQWLQEAKKTGKAIPTMGKKKAVSGYAGYKTPTAKTFKTSSRPYM